MKLDFNFTGKTLLKDWWKQVKTNFQTVQDDFNSHVSDFNTAKTALENKIISEADARNKADTALQNNINKHAAEKATDSKYSHVKLSDSVTSASGISGATAATPAAVKTAYDKAVEVQNNLDTEKSNRQNADTVLQQNIDTEAANRQNADNTLQQKINTEAATRQAAERVLQNNINDEISERKSADAALEQRITSALFGDELMTHTVKFVAPENKPTLYWDGDQEYYGEFISLDVDLINSFYIDGKQISGEFHEYCLTIPCDSDAYVVIKYNFVENTCIIIASKSAVPSTISGNVWTFTLYRYYDIRLDFKMDSSSPTGGRYVFEGCNTDYIEPNEDTTGNTYTITNTYERLPTLDNFNTENKGSFLDAINEVEKRIDEIEAAPWQISLGSEEPEGNNYIWFAPYVPQNSAQEVVLQTIDYNGDETKLHVDVDGGTNTTDNTAVSDEDGTKVILFE